MLPSFPLARTCCVFFSQDALINEPEDHVKAATVWTLGQIGRHTPDHAKAIAEGGVLQPMVLLHVRDDSSAGALPTSCSPVLWLVVRFPEPVDMWLLVSFPQPYADVACGYSCVFDAQGSGRRVVLCSSPLACTSHARCVLVAAAAVVACV